MAVRPARFVAARWANEKESSMTIHVSLDTGGGTPAVTVDHKECVDEGEQTITWVPAASQPHFRFVDVEFSTTEANPFSGPTITTRPARTMTVTENNTTSGKEYGYKITVALNGRTYDSGPIRGGPIGGGTPVIHNN
jgi:hypothetical protein